MSTPLPKLRTKFGEDLGVEIFLAFPEIQDEAKTFFDADSAIGVSTLSANGVDFSVSQYIVLGATGALKTEIAQISGGVAPTSTAITLQSASVFAHSRGDIIRFIPFNQAVLEVSTDSGVTWTPQSAVPIRADSMETYINRPTDASTTLYRFRFYNSTSAQYSQYSDTCSATGYADNTIGSVKRRALGELGEVRGDLLTDQLLNDGLSEGRRMLDQNPAIFRWSFRTQFGVVVSQVLAGQWSFPAPSDLRDRNTYKNILSIRIGSQNRPVVYQDRVRFNQNYLNVNHATVTTQAVSGQTTLVLSSTHDFDTAGAITLANNSVGDGLISVTYTGNNKATNTLTGIPASGVGSINRTVAVGTDGWQRAVYGLPTAYTISNGMIYLDVPVKIDYDGQDAKMDYYSAITPITTDSQTFDEPFYDLYVAWLKWKIKYIKANGKIDKDGDTDYKEFLSGAAMVISQETPGQRVNFVPDIEGFLSATE